MTWKKFLNLWWEVLPRLLYWSDLAQFKYFLFSSTNLEFVGTHSVEKVLYISVSLFSLTRRNGSSMRAASNDYLWDGREFLMMIQTIAHFSCATQFQNSMWWIVLKLQNHFHQTNKIKSNSNQNQFGNFTHHLTRLLRKCSFYWSIYTRKQWYIHIIL